MPFPRVLPIGHLRRWIVGRLLKDRSRFTEVPGDRVHRIEATLALEPEPSSLEGQLPISGKTPSGEPPGQGNSDHRAAVALDSANPSTRVNRADSQQVEDAATPRRESRPINQPDIGVKEREAIEDTGTLSPGSVSPVIDLEVAPQADSTRLIQDRPVQSPARTMVEPLPRSRTGSAEESNYLPEILAELFVKKEFVDPKVKVLLYGLEPINCRELADELHDFARDIGATGSQNAPPVSGHEGNAAT